MTVVWFDGFENDAAAANATRKYATVTGAGGNAAGRVAGNALSLNAALARTTPSFGLATTLVLGFGLFETTNVADSTHGIYLMSGGTEQVSVRVVHSAAFFNLRISRNGTALFTTTNNFLYSVWHFFEFKLTIDPVVGAYEVRWNEAVVGSGSGVNTANAGTTGADVLKLLWLAGVTARLDDLYLLNTSGSAPQNDYLGDCTIEGILPTAEGSLLEWSVSAGTHFSKVDDPASGPTDGTDIINSNTIGNRDLFNFADLVTITGTIYAVMAVNQAAMNAAGSRQLKHKYRDPGGTLADGSTYTVNSTTYGGFYTIYEKNPATVAAWVNSDIDGGQFGVEVVS